MQWRLRRIRSAWVIFKPNEYVYGGHFVARLHTGPGLLPSRFVIPTVNLPLARISLPAKLKLYGPQPDRPDIQEIWLFIGLLDDPPPQKRFNGEN